MLGVVDPISVKDIIGLANVPLIIDSFEMVETVNVPPRVTDPVTVKPLLNVWIPVQILFAARFRDTNGTEVVFVIVIVLSVL